MLDMHIQHGGCAPAAEVLKVSSHSEPRQRSDVLAPEGRGRPIEEDPCMRGGFRRDSQLCGAHVVCAPLVQTDFGFRGAGRTKAWATSAWQSARLASESQGMPNTMPAWPAAPPEGTAARRFPDAPFRSPGGRCCSSGISVGVGLPNMVGQRPLCVDHQSPLGLATLHYSSRSGPPLHAS